MEDMVVEDSEEAVAEEGGGGNSNSCPGMQESLRTASTQTQDQKEE